MLKVWLPGWAATNASESTWFGRWLPIPDSALSTPVTTVAKLPDWYRTMVDNCHPPAIMLSPLLLKRGEFATKEIFIMYRRSEEQLPRSCARFAGLIYVGPVSSVVSGSLMQCDHVTFPRAVKLLLSRCCATRSIAL